VRGFGTQTDLLTNVTADKWVKEQDADEGFNGGAQPTA
jgi:hypothetical protein